jgi:Tol biopolymer transport system component
MIFAEAGSTGSGADLVVAGAADASGARLFFESGPPPECARSAQRPAWFPSGDFLVVPCSGSDGAPHLVVVDLAGNPTALLDPTVSDVAALGDPSISPDGSAVLVWGSPSPTAAGGSLYVVDVGSGVWAPALVGTGDQFSDGVFSPDGQFVAFRNNAGAGNYEVVVATVTASGLADVRTLASDPGKDQDPMFSPDSRQIVYGHVDPGQNALVEELRVVDVNGDPQPRALEGSVLPAYQSVPAWSRR